VATTRKWYVVFGESPVTPAETGTALLPEPATCAHGTALPYDGVVPQSKWQSLTAVCSGLTVPVNDAVVWEMLVAGPVTTTAAPTVYGSDVDVLVSEVVDSRSVWVPGVDGLMTPSSSMLIWSPADTGPEIEQVTVVPPTWQLEPTCWPVVASVTVDPETEPSPVPAGKMIVIWLWAGLDRAPVEDVVNATV
jgi:hypothetical protein